MSLEKKENKERQVKNKLKPELEKILGKMSVYSEDQKEVKQSFNEAVEEILELFRSTIQAEKEALFIKIMGITYKYTNNRDLAGLEKALTELKLELGDTNED